MAEIKLIKLAGGDLQQHDSTNDDVSFNKVTADQISIESGALIKQATGVVQFRNSADDDFASIEAEGGSFNADVDMNGNKITNVGTPADGTDAANKDYVDSAVQGLVWQEPIINELDTPPVTPTTGDRYLVIATATGAWAGHENDIAEWDGDSWVFYTPEDGWAVWNMTTDTQKNFNGTAWVQFGSTVSHNNTSGLQGGTTDEYYHLDEDEHGALTGGTTSDADAYHTHDGKVSTSVQVIAGDGLSGGGALSSDVTIDVEVKGSLEIDEDAIQLEGDNATPGNSKYYGTDGSGTKGFHDLPSVGTSTAVEIDYTAGAGGITAGQPVYISAADTVLPADASGIATARVIGIAKETKLQTETVKIIVNGVATAGSGLTPGAPVYLSVTTGAITETPPTQPSEVVIELGIAKSATTIQVNIQKPIILS